MTSGVSDTLSGRVENNGLPFSLLPRSFVPHHGVVRVPSLYWTPGVTFYFCPPRPGFEQV